MSEPSSLNNQAAALINENKYDSAIATLQKAIIKVKLVISGDLRPDQLTSSALLQQEGDDDLFDPCLPFCDFVSSGKASCFLGLGFRDVQRSLFRCPLVLNQRVPLCEPFYKERFSYVIIYNLALAHHLKAITCDRQQLLHRRIILEKAARLYENAHFILMNSQEEALTVSVLHTLVMLCNLGHIHHVLGDLERSDLCYQHLLSTMLYVVDCGTSDEQENEIPLDGFFSNVMTLISPPSDVAPAA